MSRKPWLVFFPWGPCTLSAYTRAEGSSVGLGMAPEPGKVCQVPTWHSSLSPTWGRLAPQLLDLGLCLVLATADQGLTRLLSRGPRAQANLLAGLVRVCVLSGFSHVWFFETLWTVTPQAPLSMGFSRQEYWSGLPCPPPGDLPDPRIQPESLMSSALAGGFFTTRTTLAAPWFHLRPHSSSGGQGWGAGAGEVGRDGGVCGVGAGLKPLGLLFLPAGHVEHPHAPLSHCRKLDCESSKAWSPSFLNKPHVPQKAPQ